MKIQFKTQTGNSQPLIDVLRHIMWRTCKSSVWNRIGIPPQTSVLHMVDMSDLQAFFYSTQHDKCALAFRLKAARLGSSTSMFRMNPSTLKAVGCFLYNQKSKLT